MKKILSLMLIIMVAFLASCKKDNPKPTLTFESTNISITVDEEFALSPVITNGDKGATASYSIVDPTIVSY